MAMVAVAVNGLNHIEDLVPAVQDLGRGHAGYGVQEQHYATVGGALLDTLETALGDSFTPEIKAAWGSVYGVLSSTMIEAAKYTGNDQQAVAWANTLGDFAPGNDLTGHVLRRGALTIE